MRLSIANFLCLGLMIVLIGVPLPSLHAKVKLDSAVSVMEDYTDNLLFTSKNKKNDFGTFVIPRLNLTYDSKDVVLRARYAGNAQFYVNNTGANAYSQATKFGVDLPFLTRRFKNLEFKLIEGFNLSPQLPAFTDGSQTDPRLIGTTPGRVPGQIGGISGGFGAMGVSNIAGFGGLGGVGSAAGNSVANQGIFTRRLASSFMNQGGFRLSYHTTPRVTTYLNYTNIYLKFSNGAFKDSMTHQTRAGLGYSLSSRTRLNASYIFRYMDYFNVRTVRSHALTAGGQHFLTPTIPVFLTGGVSITQTINNGKRLNFNGSFQIGKIFKEGQLFLRFSQYIGNGGGLAASATVTRNVVLVASRQFSRTFSGFIQVGYAKNQSISGNVIDVQTVQGKAGINVGFLSWLSGFLYYSYVNQDAISGFGNTAQNNQIYFGVSAAAPTWELFD